LILKKYTPSHLSKVKRGAKNANYNQETVFKILDAHFMCHVPYMIDGTPITIPMAYARSGETIYLHGAPSNRMLNSIVALEKASLTVTHLDGLVLARSAFHHSVNYRSTIVFGKPRIVTNGVEKNCAFERLLEQMAKGRWSEVRTPNEKELKITQVLAIDITEASSKIRQGPPVDDDEDYNLELWAGVVPIKHVFDTAITDPKLVFDLKTPESAKKLIQNDK
jgi:uncharacterized protein